MAGKASVKVEIGFPATTGHVTLDAQTVPAMGGHPPVRIELVDKKVHLHHFFIEKSVLAPHPQFIDAVRDEAEQQIARFWDVVAFVADMRITPTGEILCHHAGSTTVLVRPHVPSGASMTLGVGPKWFQTNAAALGQSYNEDLLKRFNFARYLDDPVSRFVSLYSLLLSRCGDNQAKVDEALLAVDPSIACTASPQTGKPETTFTRLRNELAHVRSGTSLLATHEEIALQVHRFVWLVGLAVDGELKTP